MTAEIECRLLVSGPHHAISKIHATFHLVTWTSAELAESLEMDRPPQARTSQTTPHSRVHLSEAALGEVEAEVILTPSVVVAAAAESSKNVSLSDANALRRHNGGLVTFRVKTASLRGGMTGVRLIVAKMSGDQNGLTASARLIGQDEISRRPGWRHGNRTTHLQTVQHLRHHRRLCRSTRVD